VKLSRPPPETRALYFSEVFAVAEAEDGRPKGREGKTTYLISDFYISSLYHLYPTEECEKALYPEVLDVRDDMEMI